VTARAVAAAVTRLGGPTAVARMLRLRPKTVGRWKRRGLNPRRRDSRRQIDRLRALLLNPPDPVVTTEPRPTCATCGQPSDVMVCAACRVGSIVFDRSRGVGAVPANLRQTYKLNAEGLP